MRIDVHALEFRERGGGAAGMKRLKRQVTVAIGIAIIIAATGAAAAVSTYHTTLRNPGVNGFGKRPCGSIIGGAGTFSYDDATTMLRGSYQLTSPAPATTTFILGFPSSLPIPFCDGGACTLARTLSSADGGPEYYERLLADGGLTLYVGYSTAGQIFSGQLLPDDASVPDLCDGDAGGSESEVDASQPPPSAPPEDAAVPAARPSPASNDVQPATTSGCAAAASGCSHVPLCGVGGIFAVAALRRRRRIATPAASK